jgi:hypothetical protein
MFVPNAGLDTDFDKKHGKQDSDSSSEYSL